jgi:hypothetical protein
MITVLTAALNGYVVVFENHVLRFLSYDIFLLPLVQALFPEGGTSRVCIWCHSSLSALDIPVFFL